MRRRYAPASRVTLELDGKFHYGSYTVEDGMITVEYDLHRQSAQMDNTEALKLAMTMLRDLIVTKSPRM